MHPNIFEEILIGKCPVIYWTIYRPPNQHSTKNKLFLEKFKDLLIILNNDKNNITYVLGGFNYDLLNPNKYADLYFDSLYTMEYFLLNNKPK